MPVEVKGLIEFRRSLKQYAPDLADEMNKAWMRNLNSLASKARGFIPSQMPQELHNWERVSYNAISGRTRPFPAFNSMEAKKKIKYGYSATRPNDSGFRSVARITNLSAAGAIFETAGRKNPQGQPHDPSRGSSKRYSASNNPKAGAHFIAVLQHLSPLTDSAGATSKSQKSRKFKGRAIFRAIAEDQGKTATALIRATEDANRKFVARVNAATRKAA